MSLTEAKGNRQRPVSASFLTAARTLLAKLGTTPAAEQTTRELFAQ